jgi:REP element-mobilizing transposase RayT
MVRGIERRLIFRDDVDRQDWVDRMGRLAPAHAVRCFAWALMPNHVHIVLQTGGGALSRLMARLNTGYARRFNLRHERSGYLFQNRFKSRIVRDDADLLSLVRYVHANPLRARLVPSLADLAWYPWSGHGALVGARSPLPFEDVPLVLGGFADTRAGARRKLLRRMAADLDGADEEAELDGEPLPRPAGSSAAGDEEFEQTVARVCRQFGVSTADLTGVRRGKRLSRARAVIAFLSVARLGVPGSRVAERVGLSRSGVSRAIDRGADICSREDLG